MSLRNITVCAEVSNSGKSTFALRYLVNADLAVRYIFDPAPGEFNPDQGEFSDRLGIRAAKDRYELGLALCRGWVCFDPHTLIPGRLTEAFNFFCDWAYETSLCIPGPKVAGRGRSVALPDQSEHPPGAANDRPERTQARPGTDD